MFMLIRGHLKCKTWCMTVFPQFFSVVLLEDFSVGILIQTATNFHKNKSNFRTFKSRSGVFYETCVS